MSLPRALTWLVSLAVLAAAIALTHAEIFRADAAQVAPLGREGAEMEYREVSVGDLIYEAWLVSRHAHTLLTRPWRLWDTEHCAPEEHTLTYGVPLIGLGILGMPAALFSREPVFVYNAALVAWSAVAALCMYALVRGWTGRAAAGLVAALLFAFHPIRLDHVLHPAEWDIAWTALALLFAERLFAAGRWRDAVGLGLAGAMQVATSFYTLVASTLLALPLGLWLLLRRGPRRATPAQLAVALGCVALAAAFVLGPYLAARGTGQIAQRKEFLFAQPEAWLPGGFLFLGLPILTLACVGLAVPRRLALARVEGDPRPVLVAAALGVAFVAAGPTTAYQLQELGLPVPNFNPYAGLARLLPGLDTVRVVMRFATGVHLVACLLAGAGIAAAIGAAGRWGGRAVGAAAVALALLACFGAPLPRPLRWQLEPIRPDAATIEFFTALGERGQRGALLEVPMDFIGADWADPGPRRILLSAWHGRRTSACYGSFRPLRRGELVDLSRELPARGALDALRRMGFDTIVLHDRTWLAERERFAPDRGSDREIRLLRDDGRLLAYEILPEVPAAGGENP